MTLTLPGGESITPDDVAEFDKRKWDKFLFFFKIKPDHATLGGREIKLDLYQYVPLEDWAVAMHRHARPEDYADENPADENPADENAAEAEPADGNPATTDIGQGGRGESQEADADRDGSDRL